MVHLYTMVKSVLFMMLYMILISGEELSCDKLDKLDHVPLNLFQDAGLNSSIGVIVPITLQSSNFNSVGHIIEYVITILHSQFVNLCEAQLINSTENWNAEHCAISLDNQIATLISELCIDEKLPIHYNHISPSVSDLNKCRVVITMAYVHIDSYRNSDRYLNAGRSILPPLLSTTGHCVVFFSDKEEFLVKIREIVGKLGDKSLVTRLLQPFSTSGKIYILVNSFSN